MICAIKRSQKAPRRTRPCTCHCRIIKTWKAIYTHIYKCTEDMRAESILESKLVGLPGYQWLRELGPCSDRRPVFLRINSQPGTPMKGAFTHIEKKWYWNTHQRKESAEHAAPLVSCSLEKVRNEKWERKCNNRTHYSIGCEAACRIQGIRAAYFVSIVRLS
jgi:hypothetical protein